MLYYDFNVVSIVVGSRPPPAVGHTPEDAVLSPKTCGWWVGRRWLRIILLVTARARNPWQITVGILEIHVPFITAVQVLLECCDPVFLPGPNHHHILIHFGSFPGHLY